MTKLLLDECVTRRVILTNNDIDIQQSVEVNGLGWGATDSKIRAYAKFRSKVVVSSDYNMLCQCLDNGVQTALYYKGRAYVVRLERVEEIGINAPVLGFIAP
jgi:predicted nuclease of predicted toxin-antitoxin system